MRRFSHCSVELVMERAIMGTEVQKKSDEILVAAEEIAELLVSERWGSDKQNDKAKAALRAEIAELLSRPELELKKIDIEKLTEISSEDIIERFLKKDNLRITVNESADIEEVVTSAEFDDDDDIVSEELAEVYLQQGLKDEAKATYRKLSLLNPEKSIYFAELIAKIESNN